MKRRKVWLREVSGCEPEEGHKAEWLRRGGTEKMNQSKPLSYNIMDNAIWCL